MQKITDVIVYNLSCHQDHTDEYVSCFKIDFLLEKLCVVDVFGIRYIIDRIRMKSDDMFCGYSDEVILVFANEKTEFQGFILPKSYLVMLYKTILKEQKNGKLKGWSFDEEIREMFENYGC